MSRARKFVGSCARFNENTVCDENEGRANYGLELNLQYMATVYLSASSRVVQ